MKAMFKSRSEASMAEARSFAADKAEKQRQKLLEKAVLKGRADKSNPHGEFEAYGYRVLQTIGKGGYSKVAVKVISKDKAPHGYLNKFLPREIACLRRMQHEHIYGSGGDLLDYINRKGALSEVEAKKILHQLLSAVSYCHGMNIMHRDLKCENVLLDARGNVLLTDFGFAIQVPHPSSLLHTHCGSYAYAAPEILAGSPYSGAKSDIWSIGVILYAMVCGRLPFTDKSIKLLLTGVKLKLEFPRPVSSNVQDLLEKILVVDSRWRTSIDDIYEHAWMAGYSLVPTPLPDDQAHPQLHKLRIDDALPAASTCMNDSRIIFRLPDIPNASLPLPSTSQGPKIPSLPTPAQTAAAYLHAQSKSMEEATFDSIGSVSRKSGWRWRKPRSILRKK